MTESRTGLLQADVDRVQEWLTRAVAEAVAVEAGAVQAVRDWCDREAALAQSLMESGGCSEDGERCLLCARSYEARLAAIGEVRALLRPVRSGSPVGEVNPMTDIDPAEVARLAREAARRAADREADLAEALLDEIDP